MRLRNQILVAAVAVAAAAAVAWHILASDDSGRAAGGGPGGGGGAVPVRVAEAALGTVSERVEAVGTTRARESVDVVAEVAGRVAAIRFEEGQRVDAGDLLLEMDQTRERAELQEARAILEDTRRQLERARQLLTGRNIPQARVDELEAAYEAARSRAAVVETRLRDRRVSAPFDGVVGLREVSLGAYISPQQRITTLDDLSVIRLDFSLPERYLGVLVSGLAVEASAPAFPGMVFDGDVARIDTRVDPVSRTVRVQSEIPNPEGLLRPGMFMSVALLMEQRHDAVLVPEQALVFEGESRFLYVVRDGGAERVDVETGLRSRGEVEIRSGVAPGDLVVVAGQQRLRPGAPVRIVDPAETPSGDAVGELSAPLLSDDAGAEGRGEDQGQ